MTTALPDVLLALGAVAALAIVVIVAYVLPRGAVLAWTLVLFFVPVWVGASAGFFWYAISAVTVLFVVTCWGRVPLHPADGWMAAFVVVLVGLFLIKDVTLAAAVMAVPQWVIPYVWGRIVIARVGARWVTQVIAGVAVAAAVLGILEFVTSFNPWVLIPGPEPLYSTWSELQPRGGMLRIEGAFGHSIAMGTVLAMSSAFVIAARWKSLTTLLAVGALVSAVVLTFSRVAMITLMLTIVLSVLLLPGLSRRVRLGIVGLGVVAVAAVLPVLEAVLDAAGDEAEGSAAYRTDLLVLLRQVELFGNPGDWASLVSGEYYLGYFARSVDNALLSILLRLGYVPTALLFASVVCAVLLLLRRGARSPAAIAVAGQLPSLVVVAMITQYGTFFWFCVGLAIASRIPNVGPAEEGEVGRLRACGAPGQLSDRSPAALDAR